VYLQFTQYLYLGSVCGSLRLDQSRWRLAKYTRSQMWILWKKLLRSVYMSRNKGEVLRFRSWQEYVREYEHHRSQDLPGGRGKYAILTIFIPHISSPVYSQHIKVYNNKVSLIISNATILNATIFCVMSRSVFPEVTRFIRFKKASKKIRWFLQLRFFPLQLTCRL